MSSKNSNLIAGIHPCLEALKEGVTIEKVFMKKNVSGDNISEIKSIARERGIKINSVPIEKLNRLTHVKHQGVVMIRSQIDYFEIDQVLPDIYERGQIPLVLVLDRVTDVRNFGAIVRTAECMGCHFVVIPKDNSAQINEDAVKSSAGAIHIMPICRVASLKSAINYLKESGLTIIGASEKGNANVYNSDFSGPLALVMGSEKDGISSGIMGSIDHLCSVPLTGKVNSLNVSVAAGMFLSEINRQRL